MKFKKIDSGHYKVIKNNIVFNIFKCNQVWFMMLTVFNGNKYIRKSAFCFDTLKECKGYANELYKGFVEVGLVDGI